MPSKVWDEISYPIPKLQWLHIWGLAMNMEFRPTINNGCNYLSMLGLQLIHVSKRGSRTLQELQEQRWPRSDPSIPQTRQWEFNYLANLSKGISYDVEGGINRDTLEYGSNFEFSVDVCPGFCTWSLLRTKWTSNYIHYKVWGEIIYSFPTFIGATVERWELISNFIPHIIG